ncbi:response regulator receiver protein [Desulfarculus baarsii DSM 2075]|uniref:Response regulator receiver protein n=1 Tax=Desulfarculus baarsii (strain ATCC 33931 / DSM 2075 / LMG 7858 / VKM B-1802 / 2st14) TaxID=644282 RepID=E1QJ11_DESB2|nr:response regulator [Desulfarculus baarsii]ADK85554.1 response regulator receiver protein [Desulfarculus baarsii DSM 2075]
MMNILLVEPDRAVAWLLREELEDAGFDVRVCQSLSQAAQAMRREAVDVLLSDADCLGVCQPRELDEMAGGRVCDFVLLGPRDVMPREGRPAMVRKSADLGPLKNILFGYAAKRGWLNS